MNRLAQALVCLTDSNARAAYDVELGIPSLLPPATPPLRARPVPPASQSSPVEPIPGFPIPVDHKPAPHDATQIIEVRFTPGLAPPGGGAMPAYEVVEDEPSAVKRLPYEVVAEPTLELPPFFPSSPSSTWQPRSRRELYRQLAALRRIRGAWAKLKPHLADPREQVDRPLKLVSFLEAVAELRSALEVVPNPVGEAGRPGGLVVSLCKQSLLLDTFRVLLPDQRRSLAIDWRKGDVELEREYNRLRELSRSGRKRRPFRRRSRVMRAIRWGVRNPESVLVGLGIAVVAAALIRASFGR
jgi:hypothetical protein